MKLKGSLFRRWSSPNHMKEVWVIDEDPVSQDLIDEAMMDIGRNIKVSYFGGWLDLSHHLPDLEYKINSPDLLIIDFEELINDPQLEKVKMRWGDSSIVLWGENFFRSRKRKLLENGAHEVLKKPFDIEKTKRMLMGMKHRYLN